MLSRPFLLAWIACLFCATAACVAQENVGGVGVSLRVQDGRVLIMKLIEGGPAVASGQIHEGDQLLAVAEGDAAAEKVEPSLTAALRRIKGPAGSTVRLTIVPAGKPAADARIVTIVRAPLKGLWGDGKLLPAGADAPDLKVTGLPDDQPDRLSNHRGKVVVLVFWASWCGPCQDEMAMLQTLPPKHPEWKDKVVLLAVSGDEDKAAAVKHVKANQWNQTRNAWAGEMALRTYHIDAIPATYIITTDGKVSASNPADVEAAVAKLVK